MEHREKQLAGSSGQQAENRIEVSAFVFFSLTPETRHLKP
jgi:hypothetical protein